MLPSLKSLLFDEQPRWFYPSIARWLGIIVVTAGLYYGSAHLSLWASLPIPPGNITPLWLPSAIALVAILRLGYGAAIGVALGELSFAVSSYLDPSTSLWSAIGKSLLTTHWVVLEPLLGAYLIKRFVPTGYPFNRSIDIFKFLSIVAGCTALNATLSLIDLSIAQVSEWASFGSLWSTWWLGNTLGVIIFSPFLLTIGQLRSLRFCTKTFLEYLALTASLFVVGYTSFWEEYPIEYLLLPILAWSAFRFPQVGVTTAIVMTSAFALWGTTHNQGVFIRPSLNESLLLLQTFLGAVSLTTLLLSAVLTERMGAQEELKTANERLEIRVQERTAELTHTNDLLYQEIEERQQIELALRESETDLKQTLQDLKRTQAQLVQTEKMSGLGQMVAGMAHEINNPINFVYGNIKHVNEYAQDLLEIVDLYRTHYPAPHPVIQNRLATLDLGFLREDLPKTLNSMRVGAERIREIILTLRNFSRLDEADLKQVDIHDGIESTLLVLQSRLKRNSFRDEIEVVKHYADLPLVECYAAKLNQVIVNLCNNAIDAVDDCAREAKSHEHARFHGQITITTEQRSNDYIAIHISDNGGGIPEALQSKIFDPFFTTKPVGQGTGLGLSVGYQIVVDQHGGRFYCQSRSNEGSTFTIELPIHQA